MTEEVCFEPKNATNSNTTGALVNCELEELVLFVLTGRYDAEDFKV